MSVCLNNMERIPILDLFSGIGGFSYALNDVCETVGYCELDVSCQSILYDNMKKNCIDAAPIFDDIITLDPRAVPPEVRMLVAGSPCQDISVANTNGEGIRGRRSCLLAHVLRLAEGLPKVHTVFLENSCNISSDDMSTVLTDLSRIGFTARWGIFSASQLGAPHMRRRWFCLATRAEASQVRLRDHKTKQHDWKHERVSRLVRRENASSALKRCSVLGNSVVPQVVRYAFGTLNNQEMQRTQATVPLPLRMKLDHKTLTLPRWGTPCKTVTSWYHYRLSRRSACNMANQLFHDERTPSLVSGYNIKQAKEWMVNPQFVEWTMGYPTDYTRAVCDAKKRLPLSVI